MSVNPFEVLRLDPRSSEEEIVAQAGRLRQRTPDESDLNAIRQAVQALTASSEDRALLSLLTHPAPGHSAPALDRLSITFRRPPVPENPAPVPPLDLREVADLLGAQLAASLELPAQPFESIGKGETEEEIQRQTAEALWQSLLSNSGA